MPSIPPDRVYRGYWVDYSRGSVAGATITIDSDLANFVVAVITLLITFAGSHLWDIVAFIYFSIYATDRPRDVVHHQRQLLLRNVASPAAVLSKTAQMCWSWRKHGAQPLRRLFHLAMIALICSVSFLVAGILSSQIVSTTGIQVLADSASCGFPKPTRQLSTSDQYTSHWFKSLASSAQYARTCFNASGADPTCQIFSVQSIPFNTTYRPCPFEGACALANNSALQMDTGLLSSNSIFGVNAKHKDTISFRKVTTCAPLNLTKYERILPIDNPDAQASLGRLPIPGEQVVTYDLGPQYPYNFSFSIGTARTKTLVGYSASCIGWYMPPPLMSQSGAQVQAKRYSPLNTFTRFGGDFFLAMISSNAISYDQPCYDPVFSARQAVFRNDSNWYNTRNGSAISRTAYLQDSPAGGIGCSEKYQFCLPNGNCTKLTGLIPAILEVFSFDINHMQNVTLFAINIAILEMESDLSLIADIPQRLLANDAFQFDAMYLPSNQWELEVKSWMAIVLTHILRSLAECAAGLGAFFPGSDFDAIPRRNPGPYQHVLCHAQKMAGPDGVSNISVLGLVLVCVISGLIILTNLSFVPMLRWIRRFRRGQWDFLRIWDEEELLQYQRLAFEASGVRMWTGRSHRIPVTVGRRYFPNLASLTARSGRTMSPTLVSGPGPAVMLVKPEAATTVLSNSETASTNSSHPVTSGRQAAGSGQVGAPRS